MEKKNNSQEFREILNRQGIHTLYHFTDRDNLESIIKNGGLYSWADCENKNISINKPGGGTLSRNLDSRDGLQNYVRVSFVKTHPMMYVAMNEGRISNPVLLEIDPEVVEWKETRFSDRNATRNGAQIGSELKDFKNIHFNAVKADKHFDLNEEEQPFFQAEVMVKNFIPLQYIRNIGNFGIPMPTNPQQIQSKTAYTAQITRNTPTAFIFVLDQSGSMSRTTVLNGERMSMAEAVARIVNRQINELVLRCVKSNEVRHYYDIAVVGYGNQARSGWNGNLEGRDFVSPEELRDNPFKKIITREEVKTRKGVQIKEVEKVQWMEARSDGGATCLHLAIDYTKKLLNDWMDKHHDKDCYPPTVIHITDGAYNRASKETVLQKSNELKSMFTNDGNVLFFNVHISPNENNNLTFPVHINELQGDSLGEDLFEFSSLLPLRYNEDIARLRNDDKSQRHVAMAVNADMSTLIQLMDIGTPTNINHNK